MIFFINLFSVNDSVSIFKQKFCHLDSLSQTATSSPNSTHIHQRKTVTASESSLLFPDEFCSRLTKKNRNNKIFLIVLSHHDSTLTPLLPLLVHGNRCSVSLMKGKSSRWSRFTYAIKVLRSVLRLCSNYTTFLKCFSARWETSWSFAFMKQIFNHSPPLKHINLLLFNKLLPGWKENIIIMNVFRQRFPLGITRKKFSLQNSNEKGSMLMSCSWMCHAAARLLVVNLIVLHINGGVNEASASGWFHLIWLFAGH
jgi:hypothetical protein